MGAPSFVLVVAGQPLQKNNSNSKMLANKAKGVILTPAGRGNRRAGGSRQNTAARSEDRRGYSEFPAGRAGDRQKAARPPSGKPPSTRMLAPNGAGGVERVRRVQLHPSRFSVSAWQTLKILVGPCYGGPRTPLTTILFLAAKTARNRMAVRGSESPWRRSKLCRRGGFPRAAGNRRYTAGFPFLTAAVPPRSECPGMHRQPVGGASAVPSPGRFYPQGRNDPHSI
ncbi:hypothetical protein NDU88_005070 [Pleurodeles waltl]|uniref:Uncharacterized protein n=1 Tax=Pleurodeles waltl TaxID=8319 RepID=A0AAV7NLD8_PLEWA|nr:hypothetical protein NDU88_005070 [Pleurodeles waltl]